MSTVMHLHTLMQKEEEQKPFPLQLTFIRKYFLAKQRNVITRNHSTARSSWIPAQAGIQSYLSTFFAKSESDLFIDQFNL